MGQRTTASGTVRLDAVHACPPTVSSPITSPSEARNSTERSPSAHAAINTGIAAGALAEAAEFVRTKSRPWFESGFDTAADRSSSSGSVNSPSRYGRPRRCSVPQPHGGRCRRRADRGLGGRGVHRGGRREGAHLRHRRGGGGRPLCGLSGTRSALNSLNLHRHWRDARTHTLHDPARWKIQHIGRYVLGGAKPPRHGLL